MTITSQYVPEVVEAMLLFGSKSRGDSDFASDTDVAVFTHAPSTATLISAKHDLCARVPDVNFSVYSLTTAEQMVRDGSLFLWHLKGEGKVLFERSNWLRIQLDNLAPYSPQKALRDVGTFQIVLHDIRSSLEQDDSTVLYENATLYSVLRSLGMILSTIDGRPTFRRLEPIYHLRRVMGNNFLISEDELSVLGKARHIYARNLCQFIKLDQAESVLMAEKVTAIAEFVRSYVSQKIH